MSRRAPSPDLTLATIARTLGYERAGDFEAKLAEYLKRGFPTPDQLTRRVDPEAFERWRRLRTPHLFPELTHAQGARDAAAVAAERKVRRWGVS